VVKRKRAACLALLAASWFSAQAHAHPEVAQELVNRYVAVIAVGDKLEFFVTLLYGPVPAVEARRGMDRDGDRKLSTADLDAAKSAWRTRADELATVTVDGEKVRLAEGRVEVQIGGDDGVNAAPVVVELYGTRPLPDGTHRIGLEPGWDPPRLGETELSIDPVAGWELVASERAGRAAGAVTRFKLEGPRKSVVEDRSAVFIIRSSAAPSHNRTLPVALAIVALLAAAGLVLELRRRRPSRAGA
jgi:hypothetical protein